MDYSFWWSNGKDDYTDSGNLHRYQIDAMREVIRAFEISNAREAKQ